ncbi:D-glycerate 3-kinase, chloroplastic-like protein [Drosera capensis]
MAHITGGRFLIHRLSPPPASAFLSHRHQHAPVVSEQSAFIPPHRLSIVCQCKWIQDDSTNHINTADNGRRRSKLFSFFPKSPASVSSVQDLFEFICSGPLLDKVGLTREKITESIDVWLLCGAKLARLFKLNELYLNDAQKVRFYHYYIPVFLWCEDQVSQHRGLFADAEEIPPLVIGFSAPQGCGKTTLVYALDYLFRLSGRKIATLSIDDFYLTAEDQAKLREANPENRLLELRGNAGSHDLGLSVETLSRLTKLSREGVKMKIPRYDKSAFSGRGDRSDPSTWPEIEGPLTLVKDDGSAYTELKELYQELYTMFSAKPKLLPSRPSLEQDTLKPSAILFEGWMLGFKPVPPEVVRAMDPQLEIINKNLEAYCDSWDKFVNSWIVIKIKDPSCVYQWRLQAEVAMRADGNPGMTDEEVLDFVSRYLPAYKAYLPKLYEEGPNGSDPRHLLVVEIDEGRNPILGN